MSDKYNKNTSLLCTSLCPYYRTSNKGRNLVYYCSPPNLGREKTHEGKLCLYPELLEGILKRPPTDVVKTLVEIQTVKDSYRKKHQNLNQRFKR